MSRILVVPDIHDQVEKVERILSSFTYDKVIFLGDYFDSWTGTPKDAAKTAQWLIANFSNPNYTFLLGNHDLFYLYGEFPCSGNTFEKFRAIDNVIEDDRVKFNSYFKLCHWIGDWCLSHAGLHKTWFEHPISGITQSNTEELCKKALESIWSSSDPILLAGRSRGGPQRVGGIVWLDWSEFEPIENVNQIVGHTAGKEVRAKAGTASLNFCIDTHLNHVGVLEGGAFLIKDV